MKKKEDMLQIMKWGLLGFFLPGKACSNVAGNDLKLLLNIEVYSIFIII